MAEQLKPCPFCQSKAEVYERPNYVLVGCSGENNEVCDLITCTMTPAEWNTRPVENEMLEILEKVEKESRVLNGYIGQNGQLIKKVRAVIAKAKGGDQSLA